MKPPKFHVGQAVTPLVVDAPREEGCVVRLKMGAVYHVDWVGIVNEEDGAPYWYIGCEEWPHDECSWEDDFAPVELLPNEALAALLEEVFAPVTA